jgi:hypothetical protein
MTLTGCFDPADDAGAVATSSEDGPSRETVDDDGAVMPDVMCRNLQDAQDEIQDGGVFLSRSVDATGQDRMQVLDRNWVVVDQSPAPGMHIGEGDAVLSVVKKGESSVCDADVAQAAAVDAPEPTTGPAPTESAPAIATPKATTTVPPTTTIESAAVVTTTAPPAPATLVVATTVPMPPPATVAFLPPISQDCDPNYEGACVPIASDVDCARGSGNGPAYVDGPVYVVGTDIYGLDGNDNDGIGCE